MPERTQNEGDANQFYLLFVLRPPTLSNYIYIKANLTWTLLLLFVFPGFKRQRLPTLFWRKAMLTFQYMVSALSCIVKAPAYNTLASVSGFNR